MVFKPCFMVMTQMCYNMFGLACVEKTQFGSNMLRIYGGCIYTRKMCVCITTL